MGSSNKSGEIFRKEIKILYSKPVFSINNTKIGKNILKDPYQVPLIDKNHNLKIYPLLESTDYKNSISRIAQVNTVYS